MSNLNNQLFGTLTEEAKINALLISLVSPFIRVTIWVGSELYEARYNRLDEVNTTMKG